MTQNNKPKVLVCVTKQKSCQRLIEAGYKLIKEGKEGELHVLHVTRKNINLFDVEALQYLYDISKKYNATMNIVCSGEIIKTIDDYIEKNDIDIVVLGESYARKGSAKDMATKIMKNIDKKIKFEIIPVMYHCWDKDVV